MHMNRIHGLVLYGSSAAPGGPKDLATPQPVQSIQIRRRIGNIADRRQCRPSPYSDSVDLAIILVFREVEKKIEVIMLYANVWRECSG